ncbi:MAG: hypothetical protein K8Q91_00710 [Candidatus Vogelbacteria bacterium]|nr:hypothetical protein [Candidatus Vogelbacteria bacterium]
MTKKQTNNSGVKKVAAAGVVGAGVAALSVGAYLMFGPDAKKNRKIVRGWAVKMKGEIIEKLENAKEVTEPVYQQVVDQVSKKYTALKNVDQAELMATVNDIRKQWGPILKHSSPKKKVAKKIIKK